MARTLSGVVAAPGWRTLFGRQSRGRIRGLPLALPRFIRRRCQWFLWLWLNSRGAIAIQLPFALKKSCQSRFSLPLPINRLGGPKHDLQVVGHVVCREPQYMDSVCCESGVTKLVRRLTRSMAGAINVNRQRTRGA